MCYEKVAGVTLHAFREEIRRRKGGGDLSSPTKPTSKSKPHRKVVRQEISMEYIKWYLEQKFKTGQPIKVYYKDDTQYRTFFTYTYDDTYLRVPASAGGYNILFRLDRIRNVEM